MAEETNTNFFMRLAGKAGESIGAGLAKGIGAALIGACVLFVSHLDSHKAAETAQAHAESGTNWVGKNLHQKTEWMSQMQNELNILSNRLELITARTNQIAQIP